MLLEIIQYLESLPPETVFNIGWDNCYSYRGYYEDIAFNPATNVPISVMLNEAKSALNQKFPGYKGGEYLMHDYTYCWIAEYGHTSSNDIKLNVLILALLKDAPASVMEKLQC